MIGLVLKLAGLAALAVVVAGSGLFLSAGYWLPDADRPERADAIVLLGGDHSRPLYGADLYNQGLAPLVYVSRPAPDPNQERILALGLDLPLEQDVSRGILLAKGVPESALRFYGTDQLSTREEAANLAKVFGGRRARLLVVTSPTHTRRARMILEKALPDAELLVCATPYDPFHADWWNHRRSARELVLETAKTLFYLAGGGFFSQNAPKPAGGR